MRRELSTPQREAITRLMELGLTPCVIASDGRWLPVQARQKKPWVVPLIRELIPQEIVG